jgi:hypothetical protein
LLEPLPASEVVPGGGPPIRWAASLSTMRR